MNVTRSLLVVGLLAACGCNDELTRVEQALHQQADTLGARLAGGMVRGARDTLTSRATERLLAELVDSLGRAVARQAAASRDTLLGAYTQQWIERTKDRLLGPGTVDQVGRIRDELLGDRTVALLKNALRASVDQMRAESLNRETQLKLDTLVSRFIDTFAREYNAKISPILHTEESFFKKNVGDVLVGAGVLVVVALSYAAVVLQKRRKDRRLLDLLTYQIHEIPDRASHDALTSRIQKKAQENGTERRLREILREHGILSEHDGDLPERARRMPTVESEG